MYLCLLRLGVALVSTVSLSLLLFWWLKGIEGSLYRSVVPTASAEKDEAKLLMSNMMLISCYAILPEHFGLMSNEQNVIILCLSLLQLRIMFLACSDTKLIMMHL